MRGKIPDRLRLDREGNWFCSEGEITHPRTVRLFSGSIRKTPQGYQLVIGSESCPVEVEDTPFMIRRVDFNPGQILLHLNDGTEEELDPSSLKINPDNILYCRVKRGEYPARFLRAAYYQLAGRVEYNREWGYHLTINEKTFPLFLARETPDE